MTYQDTVPAPSLAMLTTQATHATFRFLSLNSDIYCFRTLLLNFGSLPCFQERAEALKTELALSVGGGQAAALNFCGPGATVATCPEAQMIQDMINAVNTRPQYCVRPATDPPFSTNPCGTDPNDQITTDPGRGPGNR